ncbi:MAG: SgcJ/EcaC family oxidoreductase [Planctomycetia bacterium]|nr:SgcJ/EcaC family oxidoreductase [Planctomycetia bacterium]
MRRHSPVLGRSLVVFSLLIGLPLPAGCLPVPAGSASRSPEAEPPARVTSSADPVRRTIRPVPEVIARPRPFRLPESLGRDMRSEKPATMEPAIMEPGDLTPGRSHAPATVVSDAARAAAAVAAAGAGEPALLLPPPAQRSLAGEPGAVAAKGRSGRTDAAGSPEVAEIREMMRGYLRAFNRHDPAALAAHWSRDGENLDLDTGETTSGRQAVQEVFAALFREDAGATIDIDISSIRAVRGDVAVVDGVSLISFSDEPPSSSRFTAIVGKQDGRWVLESVRESAVPGAAAAAARPLDELDWLVGSWEDVSEEVTVETRCFWSTGRGFLIRTHAVSGNEPMTAAVAPQSDAGVPAGVPQLLAATAARPCELTEIIGWDPESRQVRSWVFASNGRFAQGSWSRDGEGWRVHLQGGGVDAAADCTYRISRVGPDEVAVRCESGGLAGVMPPAVDAVRTARLLDAGPAAGSP